MRDPRIDLKNPWIAAVLGFLVPGAGHAYQRRYFKSAVYFVCIVGLYVTGMQMADWKAVYIHRPGGERPRGKHHTLQFLAQAGVGLPAACAILQNQRYYAPRNVPIRELQGPFRASFQGELDSAGGGERIAVQGTVELGPADGPFGKVIRGQFHGTTPEGEKVDLLLGERLELAEPVNVDRRRRLDVAVIEEQGNATRVVGRLRGSVPRPFWNWFVVPVDTLQERQLHARLGKFHELAMVFTWVAGLLNILAVWDAFEGPAYGYGDEESEADDADTQRPAGTSAAAKPGRTPAQASA